MNLVTYEYDVIPTNGTVAGELHYYAAVSGYPGIIGDSAANESLPEPTRNIDSWSGGTYYGWSSIDGQIVYSPNPDGGESGPDTIKGNGFMFQPAGDRLAVEAWITIDGNTQEGNPQNGWEGTPFPSEAPWLGLPCYAIWGIKAPNPELWPISINGNSPSPGVSPYGTASVRTQIVPWRYDATNNPRVTADIADIYNELINQPGFTSGNKVVFGIFGIPTYGQISSFIVPGTAVLHVTVDLDAAIPVSANIGSSDIAVEGTPLTSAAIRYMAGSLGQGNILCESTPLTASFSQDLLTTALFQLKGAGNAVYPLYIKTV